MLANLWEREIDDLLSKDLRVTRLFCLTVNNVHVKFIPFRRAGWGRGHTRRVIGPLQTLCVIMHRMIASIFQVAIQKFKDRRYRTIILPVVLYGCETWSLTLGGKEAEGV